MVAPGSKLIASAAFVPAIPSTVTPVGVADSAFAGFPLEPPTFAILTTGNAAQAADPQASNANTATRVEDTSRGTNAHDITVLRMNVDIPALANCLTLGFRFLSEEYPNYVGKTYNDAFIAEVDPGANGWTANSTITAPKNFAFDEHGDVISVNTTGATSMSAAEAAGTVYGGATPRLSAAQPVTPGRHELVLSIFDGGDALFDSAVFVDHLSFLRTDAGGCVPGAQADEVAPTVTLGVTQSSPDDVTPTFSGTAGDAAGDSANVTVQIYPGGSASGTPVQTRTATRSGKSWSVDAAPLAPGTYTARAQQTDTAGNTGSSAATFAVASPPPPPTQTVDANTGQSPEPELGRTVVAGTVSGIVRVKGKDGKFHTLGANESIPLGSEIDATRGRVRLTSAADTTGTTQTADFYKGAFVVTQTKGSKPITQLALTGKLSCAKAGKASAAAKRKRVRRLWGDGHGSFRTKGKRAAATVRGTKWLTEDRCGSTKITVRRGVVLVRDFVKRKNVRVRKGHSYVARAKPKKK